MSSSYVKRNLAILGDSMSLEEFLHLIKEAEKSPFYTLEEVKTKMDLWKKSLKIKTK